MNLKVSASATSHTRAWVLIKKCGRSWKRKMFIKAVSRGAFLVDFIKEREKPDLRDGRRRQQRATLKRLFDANRLSWNIKRAQIWRGAQRAGENAPAAVCSAVELSHGWHTACAIYPCLISVIHAKFISAKCCWAGESFFYSGARAGDGFFNSVSITTYGMLLCVTFCLFVFFSQMMGLFGFTACNTF